MLNAESSQQPKVRLANFAACGQLYELSDSAERLDILDQLQARLSQLEAMLTMTFGNSYDSFHNHSVENKDNYLWCCKMLASECKELSLHANDNLTAEVESHA